MSRSENMRRIHAKNTKPELLMRMALYHAGIRYQIHVSSLPAKPDIVIKSKKIAIFVHGCFWHGHPIADKHPDRRRIVYAGNRKSRARKVGTLLLK